MIALIVAVLSVLAHAASNHRVLGLLCGLRMQYLGLSAAALLGLWPWLLKRGRPRALRAAAWIALSCVALNAWSVLPYWIPSLPRAVHGQSLKFMLFNVLGTNRQFDEVRGLVSLETPDCAVFLEATGPWPEELQVLAEELPYHLSIPETQFEIYSRYPIRKSGEVLYGETAGFGWRRGVVCVDLQTPAGSVALLAAHTFPPLHFGQTGFAYRNEQLVDGIPRIAANVEIPLVLLGDLNADMWSPYFRQMLRTSGLLDARIGSGVLPTQCAWPRPGFQRLLGRPIDHCLVSPGIRVEALYTGPHTGSDHLPLFAILSTPLNHPTEGIHRE